MSPDSEPDPSDTPVEELFLRYLSSGERGDILEQLCRENDALAGDLRERVVLWKKMGAGTAPGPQADFDGFQLIKQLGSGGMGTVYLAQQKALNRLVAIKVLHPAYADSERAKVRFAREYSAIAKLEHAHIVPVYTVGVVSGVPYFAMALMHGRPLSRLIAKLVGADLAKLSAEDVGRLVAPNRAQEPIWQRPYAELCARLIAKVARALEHAHGRGVLHRDIKPSNILITPDAEPMLYDFGLARDEEAPTLTLTGEFAGTPNYVSPEQLSTGRMVVDHRTDIYSLGMTLYEMLTLTKAFGGTTSQEVFRQVLVKDPISVRKRNPFIPRDLETIVHVAIEKDPDRRYPSAAEMASDLEKFLEFRPIHAKPSGAVTRSLKWARRNPSLVSTGSVILIALASIAFVLLHRSAPAQAKQLMKSAILDLDASRAKDALNKLQGARSLDPDSAEISQLLVRAEQESRRAEALEALALGKERLEAARAQRLEVEKRRAEYAQFEHDLREGYLSREQTQALFESERQLEEANFALDSLFDQTESQLFRANNLDASLGESRELHLACEMERFRRALSDHDDVAARFRRERIMDLQPDAATLLEIQGRGTLHVTSTLDRAEVYLFAYRSQAEVKPKGDGRLVPVPSNGSELATGLEIAPGDPVLVVGCAPEDGGAEQVGLHTGDLITEVNGFPCDEGVFVTRVQAGSAAAKAGFSVADRITYLDNLEVTSLFDVDDITLSLALRRSSASTETRPFRLRAEHGSRANVVVELDLRGGTLSAASGLTLGTAWDLLRAAVPVPLELTIVSHGERRAETLPEGQSLGVPLTHTTYPLIFTAQNRIGVLPLDPFSLDPGSYLVVMRHPDYGDLRLTTRIDPLASVELEGRMLRRGSVPDGFIHVPRGTISMGNDAQAFTQLKEETKVVGDFFIAEREVTVGEYLAFLNDPAQRAERQRFEPFDPDDPAPRDPSGRPTMSIGTNRPLLLTDDMPILGVPFAGAERYCQWLSARNPKWRFRLPTTNEWIRAASGNDSRPFPWGAAFAWLFCKSGFCRPAIPFLTSNPALPEPVMRCLGDESPFGVRDLAGSAREWLASDGIQNQAPLIGGSWVSTNMRDFRCTSPDSRSLQECDWTWGFRICAEAKDAKVGK